MYLRLVVNGFLSYEPVVFDFLNHLFPFCEDMFPVELAVKGKSKRSFCLIFLLDGSVVYLHWGGGHLPF